MMKKLLIILLAIFLASFFIACPQIPKNLTITIVGSGDVIANETTITSGTAIPFDEGTVVTLVVTPASGYEFTGWSGANATDVSTTTPYTITMNTDKVIIATFTAIGNQAPTVSNVIITGTAQVGETLTGSYSYNDAEGDLEGTSTFRWLSCSTSDGTYTPITGATTINYVLQATDENQYIKFEVTPIAQTGTLTGLAYQSNYVGPISSLPIIIETFEGPDTNFANLYSDIDWYQYTAVAGAEPILQGTKVHNGTQALRLGGVEDVYDRLSSVAITVNVANVGDSIKFWFLTSCESSEFGEWDGLRLLVNGVKIVHLDNYDCGGTGAAEPTTWTQYTYTFTETGQYVLEWVYRADSTWNFDNAVYVDDIELSNGISIIPNSNDINVTTDLVTNTHQSLSSGAIYDLGLFGSGTTPTFNLYIYNTGILDLNLTGTAPDYVTTSGDTYLTVTTQPVASTIIYGNYQMFTCSIDTSTVGEFTTTLTIPNDDTDENPYTINVNYEVEAPTPRISLMTSTGSIPVEAGSTYNGFGKLMEGYYKNIEFKIRNVGTGLMTYTSPSITITGDAEFTCTSQPAGTSIDIGAYRYFTIRFTGGSTAGIKTATITFTSDAENSPYTFNVTGEAFASPTPSTLPETFEGNGTWSGLTSGNQWFVYPDTNGTIELTTEDSVSPTHSVKINVPTNQDTTRKPALGTKISSTDANKLLTFRYKRLNGYEYDTVYVYRGTTSLGSFNLLGQNVSDSGWQKFFKPIGATGEFYIKIELSSSTNHSYPTTLLIDDFNLEDPSPEISVLYSGTEITSGGTTTLSGPQVTSGATTDYILTIANVGTGSLTLIDGDSGSAGDQFVTLGAGADSRITIQAQPTVSSVAASGSTSFIIRYTGNGTTNVAAATINVHSNDSDENPYIINISLTPNPNIVVVGTGNEDGYNLPVDDYYRDSYTQSIYLKSEIGNMPSKKISSIKLQIRTTQSQAWCDPVTIYIGHTTKTQFDSTTDWIPVSGLTTVWTGRIDASNLAVGMWYEITLTTPFVYNNTDNIVIAYDQDNADYGSNHSVFAATAGTNRSMYINYNSQDIDPASPPAGTVANLFPNIQFIFSNQ